MGKVGREKIRNRVGISRGRARDKVRRRGRERETKM